MTKLIVFDWDDVFVTGSIEGYYKCYHEAVVGVGFDISIEEERKRIAARWGSSHREELAEVLREKPELLEKASQLYEEQLFGDTFVNCLKPITGTQELLARLAKKHTLALATGVHPKLLQERIMPKFNIPNVFAQIISAYDLDSTTVKPNPFSLQKIMETQHALPPETLMVGDAKNDVLMAQNADVEPVVVLTGHLNREEAKKLGVNHIIEDVTQLEQVL